MIKDLSVFIFSIFLSVLSGNMAYYIATESGGDFRDIQKLKNIHQEMQEVITPELRLDLNSEYPSPEHLKLLTAKLNLNTQENSYKNSAECLRTNLSRGGSNFINKQTLWMTYYCNQIEQLPNNFFITPPFVDKNGHSFAFLKFKLLRSNRSQISWLNKYSDYMHIKELKRINWYNSADQRFLISLSDDQVRKIAKGEAIFTGNGYYFIKTGNLKYFIITLDKAKRFFSRTKYIFDTDSKSCLFLIGSVCWNKRSTPVINFLSKSIHFIFFVSIITFIILSRNLFLRIKKQKLEEDKKKHALRVLTHELRTPISSMILISDQIQSEFDSFPKNTQENFLKLEGQIYRLKSLAEKSKGYLQTDSDKLIELKPINIESIKDFINSIKDEYDNVEIVIRDSVDYPLHTDPYWLKMCVTNLIENAIRYGSAPIELHFEKVNNYSLISIIDGGELKISNIKKLLNKKHKQTKGLGLGLNIVNETVNEMNGELLLKNNPTTFIIKIPLKYEEKK